MVMGMYKLLVNSPAGGQEIFEVFLSGGYFDESRVIWDERKDGAMPEGIVLGGMVRVVTAGQPSLEFDQALFDLNAAPEPVATPADVSAFQLEIALLDAGHTPAVDVLITTSNPRLRIEFLRRDRHRRDGAVALARAEHLQLEPAQVDDLFKAAAAVQ